jgi:bifunctional DNA primase/polymerase-like protein
MTSAHTLRLQLVQAGYIPIALHGKVPPQRSWQKTESVTPAMLAMWDKSWPDATNTGVLTRLMPTLDVDILDAAAASHVAAFVRERYEDAGYVLARTGKAPKFAIPFRTEEPFKKIVVNLIAPDGSEGQKIEFLADGEQVVVNGIHPETKQSYRWSNGGLEQVKLEDLPYIREDEARALVDELVEFLIRNFGYKRTPGRPKDKANGDARPKDDWTHLFENIRVGRE